MGNQILVDKDPISLQSILEINSQALTSSWIYSNDNTSPLAFRMWRISETKDQIQQEPIDFVKQRNIGIGFSRDEAYIALAIRDLKNQIKEIEKVPFYVRMFIDSLNNISDQTKSSTYIKKCDNYSVQITLMRGKRVSSSTLLKALKFKLKQAEEKLLQALIQGAALHNSKLSKRPLVHLEQQTVECPISQILNFKQKASQLPLLNQMFGKSEIPKYHRLPFQHGINYWYLFNQQKGNSEPFQLDITGIHIQNPVNFSDFQNELQLGMKQKQIIGPQLGDMSLSLLNQISPIVRFQMPNIQPFNGKSLNQKHFYLLCKQKSNGVDIVMWEGNQWSRDSQTQGDFMEQVITTNFGKWPANKIFLHHRGYNID